MSNYTNLGLVRHAEMALALKTKYMWGGLLRPITDAYIGTLRNIYGTNTNTGYTEARYRELSTFVGKGYYGCDCVGLIKSYYWSGKDDGGTGSPNYGASGFPDVNANYMYQQARVKGDIKTLPERPGVIVYCKTHPHVGVYVGKGYVIESTLSNRGDGVVKTKLSDFNWEYWFECPYIAYVSSATVQGNPMKYIYQATSRAAIREGTSKSAKLVSRVVESNYYVADMGTRNSEGSWFRYAGTKYWSMLIDERSLFKKVGEYTTKKVAAKLNVRTEPTTKSEIITTLKPDTIIYVWQLNVAKANGYTWAKIVIDGKIGYVAQAYIK